PLRRQQYTGVHEPRRVERVLDARERGQPARAELAGDPLAPHAADAVVVGDGAPRLQAGLHHPGPAIVISLAQLLALLGLDGEAEVQVEAGAVRMRAVCRPVPDAFDLAELGDGAVVQVTDAGVRRRDLDGVDDHPALEEALEGGDMVALYQPV